MENIKRKILNVILAVFLLVSLYIINLYNYQLFHSIAEIFSIVVAFSIYMISWNARAYADNDFLLFLGIAYLFIGGIDLLHIVTFEGMNIIAGANNDTSVQLWVAARYIQSFSLLIAFVLLVYKKKRIKVGYIFTIYTLIVILVLLSIFYFKSFPSCYNVEQGLSNFKTISEYIICLILIITIFLLIKNRRSFDAKVYRYIFWSIIFNIISELAFTMYFSFTDWQNLLGHYFKILSIFLIYKAIIERGIKKPYDLIFRELKIREKELENQAITDDLTGVFNRRAAFEILEKMLKLSQRNEQFLTICFLDIDDLKLVNDRFGHGEGDKLLVTIATVLEFSVRDSDFISRLGGDEFLLIFPDCNLDNAQIMLQRIKDNLSKVNKEDDKDYAIQFSNGLAQYDYHEEINVDKLIEMADSNMYQNKANRKKNVEQLTIEDFNR